MEKKKSKNVSYIALGLFLVLVSWSAKLLVGAGTFKTLHPHSAYQCIKVKGGYGVEDITLDSELGVAFISSLKDRRRGQRGAVAHGAIVAYLIDKPEMPVVDLTPKTKYFEAQFHPQGFSFYHAKDGKKYLFVINRRTDIKTVELFEFNNMSLTHIETFRDSELMTNPNNLIAVGSRQFYVSNYRVSSSKLGQQLEQLLALPVSYLLYFDGLKFRKAATGLKYANGVEASRDGKIIYVASTTNQTIEVYSRDIKTGELQHMDSIFLNTHPDNLYVDDKDNIWVGALPKGIEFFKYRYEKVDICPSQVLKVTPDDQGSYVIKEVYLNMGNEISASTSVIPYKNRMLVGGVYEDYFIDCFK